MIRFLKENLIFILSSIVVLLLIVTYSEPKKIDNINKEIITKENYSNLEEVVQTPLEANKNFLPTPTSTLIKKDIPVVPLPDVRNTQTRQHIEREENDD